MFSQGCFTKLIVFIQDNAIIIGGVAAAVGGVMVGSSHTDLS